MINQYFNVYALRRVRCAGYATGAAMDTSIDQDAGADDLTLWLSSKHQQAWWLHGG